MGSDRDEGTKLARRAAERVRNPGWPLVVVGALSVLCLGYFGASLLGGGDGGDDTDPPPGLARIEATRSSWTVGQASLAEYDEFDAIASRSESLGDRLLASYRSLLADIEEAKRESEERARQEALRRFREAQRQYRLALERAEANRKRLLAKRRRELREELARLREENKIEPGEECDLPEVREVFDCETGYPF